MHVRPRSLLAFCILLLAACASKKEDTAKTTPSSTTTATAPTTATKTASADPEEASILAVTKKWNDALAKRDSESLRALYDDKVRLYTTTTDRAGAVKAKAAAFTSAKDYTQSIGPVEVDLRDKNKPSASFEKTWTANGKTSKVLARLKFVKGGGGGEYKITEESDNPSDARRKKASDPKSCEAAIVEVVSSVPSAKKILNGPTNPAAGHTSNGMRLDPHEDNPNIVAVAIHESHADHLTTLGWYDVDTQSGIVKETMPEDVVVTADPAKVTAMKAACKK
jgi:hypothetical protein